MKVQLEIPEPKFKPGDVVRRPNRHNEYQVYFAIIGHVSAGEYQTLNGAGAAILPKYDEYHCVVQAGSVVDSQESRKRIMPGTIMVRKREELEEECEKIAWPSLIYSQNTQQNLTERWDKWDEEKGNWKEPLTEAAK